MLYSVERNIVIIVSQ